MSDGLPDGLIAIGSNANCTIALCGIDASILTYKPSVAASIVFITLFAITMAIHLIQGLIWRDTLGEFSVVIAIGCIDEIIGYIGRLMLHHNVFSFNGFLIEIICLTTAPVFFCAAIYVTLARTIDRLERSLARFNPNFFYYFFVPCDIVSLVLQATGGAMSSGNNDKTIGADIALAGLALQVFTLVIFSIMFADFVFRFYTDKRHRAPVPSRVNIYFIFLTAAITFILIRCCFRLDELSDGYTGSMMHKEGLFYALESAMVTAGVFCLNVAHPGFGLSSSFLDTEQGMTSTDQNSDMEMMKKTKKHGL